MENLPLHFPCNQLLLCENNVAICYSNWQVVPTEYRYLSKKVLPTNQFSVTEYFVPMRPTDRSWPGNPMSPLCSQSMASSFFSGLIRFSSAAVYFLYDLSPITVTIKEERRNFLHFITRLCAVLGGTFAMTGLLLAYKIVFLSYAAVRIGFNKKKVVYGIPSCMQGLHIKKNKQKYWLMCSIMFHLHQTDTHFSASCVGMLDRWMYRIIESVSSSKPRSGMR
jgi:hypothetical protein